MILLSDPPLGSEGLSFLVFMSSNIVPGRVSRNAWVISVAANSCTTMTAYEAETTTAVLSLISMPPNLLVLELEGMGRTHLRFILVIAHHVPEDINSSQIIVTRSFYRTPFCLVTPNFSSGLFYSSFRLNKLHHAFELKWK